MKKITDKTKLRACEALNEKQNKAIAKLLKEKKALDSKCKKAQIELLKKEAELHKMADRVEDVLSQLNKTSTYKHLSTIYSRAAGEGTKLQNMESQIGDRWIYLEDDIRVIRDHLETTLAGYNTTPSKRKRK